MKNIVVATRNKKKIAEIGRILEGTGIGLLSLDEYPGCPETVEDGETFEANALKKAREVSAYTGKPAFSDDSGLVIDALGGEPGVYSARYAGENASDADNLNLALKNLGSTPPEKRTARFMCVIALVDTDGTQKTFEGSVEGTIAFEPAGESGFGYDPVFIPEGHSVTFAQMSAAQKDSMSHRGRALEKFREYLKKA